MRLVFTRSEYTRICDFLFRDSSESMVLGLCERADSPGGEYVISELFYPKEKDFVIRKPALITLKAESAYPLLKRLGGMKSPAFLQIHSHAGKDGLFFSNVDDTDNAFNVSDIREFHPACRFFRIVFAKDANGTPVFLAQRFVFPIRFFIRLKVRIAA